MAFLLDFLMGDSHCALNEPVLWITIFVSITAAVYLSSRNSLSKFPAINQYAGDWFNRKAKEDFVLRADELLDRGERKYPGKPFRIIATLGEKLVLPRENLNWVKSHPDLDHQKQVAEEFFGAYPGFEGIGAFNDPNQVVIKLVKKHMSQMNAAILQTFEREADDVLKREFGMSKEYHDINWARVCTKLILRLSSLVFVGPRLAGDEDWQRIATSYTTNLFQACRALRAWPQFLRPLAVWIIPECGVCRQQVSEARKKLSSITVSDAEANTAMAWVDPNADVAAVQLALAAGALHTTSQLLNQCVLDLAYSTSDKQDLVERLRDEYETAVEPTSGKITPAVLPKLDLLDACIKETQRLKPQTLTNLERLAMKPLILPDGTKIPKGTMISVPSAPMWDPRVWGTDASIWNPNRHVSTSSEVSKDRKTLVSSDERHFAFGMGRFICPGRFMVNAELKVVLSRMLRGWDVRLKEADYRSARATGLGRVDWMKYGFEQLANEQVGVEVRRRA